MVCHNSCSWPLGFQWNCRCERDWTNSRFQVNINLTGWLGKSDASKHTNYSVLPASCICTYSCDWSIFWFSYHLKVQTFNRLVSLTVLHKSCIGTNTCDWTNSRLQVTSGERLQSPAWHTLSAHPLQFTLAVPTCTALWTPTPFPVVSGSCYHVSLSGLGA